VARAAHDMKIALVASSGGHLYELFCVRDFWKSRDRFWVSFPTADAKYLLRDEGVVYWAAFPTVRNVPNMLRNIALAWRVLRSERPDLILTTGAGVAAPFIWIGKLLGIRSVYIDSVTRISEISLTARLVYPFVDRLLVQWEELTKLYPKAEYRGRIL
jgi:beta-1,4-N-acetylglucosaminyltransferase